MRITSTTTVAVGALAAIVLTACAGTTGSVTSTVTVTQKETVTAAPSEAVTETPDDATPTPSGAQATFGQTYTYTDGLAVTVSKPLPYKPSEYAACDKAKAYRAWQITVKNGTTETFKPSMFSESIQSGQSEASQCYDSGQGFNSSPSTKLLPGRTVTWKVGFGLADPADIVMEVRPSFDYESAIFTN